MKEKIKAFFRKETKPVVDELIEETISNSEENTTMSKLEAILNTRIECPVLEETVPDIVLLDIPVLDRNIDVVGKVKSFFSEK